MTILQSEIAVGSEQYQQNRDALLNQIAEVRAVQQKGIDKSYAAKPKFDKKGKILPHERYVYFSMLIHLLWSYAVSLATTCMMIKMALKRVGVLSRELVLSVAFVLWSLPVIAQSKAAPCHRWVYKNLTLAKIALEQNYRCDLDRKWWGKPKLCRGKFYLWWYDFCQSGTNVCGRDSHKFRWYMVMPPQVVRINQVYLTM